MLVVVLAETVALDTKAASVVVPHTMQVGVVVEVSTAVPQEQVVLVEVAHLQQPAHQE